MRNRAKWPLTLFAAFLAALMGLKAFAADGRELLKESEARHRSASMEYSGDLTVYAKGGKVRKKSWKSYRLGYADDAKVLVRFTAPPEVRNVGFLSVAKSGKNADQWLYLPSMKRERRIGSQDRDASFVGTDFSYEDMEEFDHRKYSVKLTGEEAVEGQPCYVIEARPTEEGDRSIYPLRRLYLRKDILYLVRSDLYREGEKAPSKTLELKDIVESGGHYTARLLTMTDHFKGSKTVVELKDVAYDTAQPGDRFTLKNLNREGGD